MSQRSYSLAPNLASNMVGVDLYQTLLKLVSKLACSAMSLNSG
jgi:hypothetical protein